MEVMYKMNVVSQYAVGTSGPFLRFPIFLRSKQSQDEVRSYRRSGPSKYYRSR
jgi:hypothetical protein